MDNILVEALDCFIIFIIDAILQFVSMQVLKKQNLIVVCILYRSMHCASEIRLKDAKRMVRYIKDN